MSATPTKKNKTQKEVVWDPVYEPLVNHVINAVKIRPAVEVGKRAVEYFRANDLIKWVLRNEENLRNKFPGCFDDPASPLTSKHAQQLAEDFSRLGFIYKAHYKPISDRPAAPAANEQAQSDTGKVDNSIPKWPKRLEMARDQHFDIQAFYVLRYEPKSNWPYVYLALIIGGVLVVCLFPAWPLAMKLFTWYISVCLMTFIMGSVILRLFTFILLWFFGVDFWIFPNLFDEELGVIDSFRPLYSWLRRGDDWSMLAARIFLGILMIASGYQLSQTHTLSDIHRFTAQQFLDVLDWGHQKLAAPHTADLAIPAQPGAKGIHEDPTQGFRCLQSCGFDTYDIFKDDCSFDCVCMTEVLSSHCFKKCPDAAKKSLEKSHVDACKTVEEHDEL